VLTELSDSVSGSMIDFVITLIHKYRINRINNYRMCRDSSAAEKLLASLKGLLCIGCDLTMPGWRFVTVETSSFLGYYAVSSGVINTDVSNNRNAFIC
jgi:hypothetical protein